MCTISIHDYLEVLLMENIIIIHAAQFAVWYEKFEYIMLAVSSGSHLSDRLTVLGYLQFTFGYVGTH